MNGLIVFASTVVCTLIWIGCSCVYGLTYPWITPPWVDRWIYAAIIQVLIAVWLWVCQLLRMLK